MSDSSGIQWTDATWNPVTGCDKISPGCANCYAERMARRLKAMGAARYRDGFKVATHPEALDEPLRWRKPRRVFACSMGDLFHDDVPDEFIAAVFGVMAACPQHTFQVLTKRAGRMREWFEWIQRTGPSCHSEGASRGCLWYAWDRLGGLDDLSPARCPRPSWPLPNVWLGVTAEDQDRADERIPHLLATPAAVRFVSVEPMLGPIDLDLPRCDTHDREYVADDGMTCNECAADGWSGELSFGHWIGDVEDGLHWVIAGCESGPKRRDAAPDWFRSLRDQCQDAGVPFFLKQAAIPVGGPIVKMPPLDGRVWDQAPEPTK